MINGKTPEGWRAQRRGGTAWSASLKSSSLRKTRRSAGPREWEEPVLKLMLAPCPCWVTRDTLKEKLLKWLAGWGERSQRKLLDRRELQRGAVWGGGHKGRSSLMEGRKWDSSFLKKERSGTMRRKKGERWARSSDSAFCVCHITVSTRTEIF